MGEIVAITVPLGICVALPVLIVWLVVRARQNETNRRAEILLKAIYVGAERDNPVGVKSFFYKILLFTAHVSKT